VGAAILHEVFFAKHLQSRPICGGMKLRFGKLNRQNFLEVTNMAKKFTEKELLSLVAGIKVPTNTDAVKDLGIDILEIEPYEKTDTRYINNRFNPLVISGEYFNVSMTISVNETQAAKIAALVKDDYQKHKANAAVAALVAAGFTPEQAQAILKKKGK
jgi:hypothetical protein